MEKVLDKELKGIIFFDSHDYADHLWRHRWKQIVTIRYPGVDYWYYSSMVCGGNNISFMIEIESDTENASDY